MSRWYSARIRRTTRRAAKIITPLKDRIGSEIRTHYPATVEEGIAITAQEAWTRRNGRNQRPLHLPNYVQEVIERVAFAAREDKKIDKRSGVSQRLPISAMENVISNAERRAIRNDEKVVVPRISDVYAALPAITGKLELEYEGEMKGADHVGRELIRCRHRQDLRRILHRRQRAADRAVVRPGRRDSVGRFGFGRRGAWKDLKGIQGLLDKLGPLSVSPKDTPEQQVSAAEFILEGLHAHKRIGRSEERIFKAGEKKPEPVREKSFEPEREAVPAEKAVQLSTVVGRQSAFVNRA